MKLNVIINDISIREGTAAKSKEAYRMVQFHIAERPGSERMNSEIQLMLSKEETALVKEPKLLIGQNVEAVVKELKSGFGGKLEGNGYILNLRELIARLDREQPKNQLSK
jgi:hypothetical protein